MKFWTFLAAGLAAASAAVAAPGAYRISERIPGPDGGWDFARIDAVNNRLLVTRGISLMSLDLATRKVTGGLAAGERLHDALPVNGSREILVTYGNANAARFVDGQTGATLATVATGKNPDAVGQDPKSGLVLVMNHSGGDITLIDPKAHAVAGTIIVGGDLEMAAFDGKGLAFVNVEDRNETVAIDVAAAKVLRRIKLPGCDGPTGIAYHARRRWLIASCDGSTTIVEAASGKLVKSLKSGKEADGVGLDERSETAFVAGRDGTLTVISLAGKAPTVAQVLKTEPDNRTLAVDPRDGRVYIPAARLAKAPGAARPTPVPGTFEVLVVSR
ncbi:hypothetical protein [Phenylobacterium sp.]|jgi:hypothetical protein|uniref:YncE family protein n=1 Tax=Phenylobacterium sp. TaxID=1871053 RepID=UPI002F3F3271